MKKKRGQAIVEIALGIPIILILFCGIVDFGMVLYAQSSLNMVAQESVRLSGLGSSEAQVTQFALSKMTFSDKNTALVKFNYKDASGTQLATGKSGDYVTLSIDYGVKYLTPVLGIVLPSPYPVHAQATIRLE